MMPTLQDLQALAARARALNEPPLFLGTFLFCLALCTGICLSVIVSPDWQLAWETV